MRLIVAPAVFAFAVALTATDAGATSGVPDAGTDSETVGGTSVGVGLGVGVGVGVGVGAGAGFVGTLGRIVMRIGTDFVCAPVLSIATALITYDPAST